MPTILVVDDADDIRDLVREILTDEGHQVVVAASARHALKWCAGQVPDLLICDERMPGMSGTALLAQLRTDPRAAALRVLLMSGGAPPAAPWGGRSTAFLPKPFDLDELVATVARLLST